MGLTVVVAVAVVAGPAVLKSDRSGVLVPLAVAGGLGMAVLAFTRFELFLMLVIALRASMDAAKIGSSSVDATGALSVLFIGATAVWLVRDPDSLQAPSPLRSLVAPFTAFFCAALLSIAFSEHPFESALEAVRIGTVVVIVVALGRVVRDRTRIRQLLYAVFVSALVPIAFACLQLVGGSATKTFEGYSRIKGTFVHPNSLAMYLFLIIVLGAALVPHVPLRSRWLVGASTLVSGAILITTYARGAWLATLIALIVIGLLQSRVLLWVLAGAIVLIWAMVPSVGVRLSDLSEDRTASGAPANSLAWRIQYWDEALDLQDNPVLGIGLREVELNQEEQKAPHNDFVRVYVETGIVGLVAYLWLLIALFVEAVRNLHRARQGLARGLAVALLGALTGLVVLSLAANVISQLVILWYFAAIVVLAVASSRASPSAAPAAA